MRLRFMRTRKAWKRLTRYVAGESNEREAAELEAQLAVDEDQARLLREIEAVWRATEKPGADLDVDTVWERFEAEAWQTARVRRLPAARPSKRSRRSLRRASGSFPYRTAVTLAVVVLVVVLAVQFIGPPDLRRGRVFVTQRGEQALIRLNDGTRVRLNANTRLILPHAFSARVRDVRLEGEAYFDVARDTTRPFRVHTADGTIRVLGTKFNVQAYPDGVDVEVVVAEGKVAFRAARASSQEKVVLTERQMLRLLHSGRHVVRQGVDVNRQLGWMEGRLVFDDAPFDEVARTLERWYDLQIEVRVPPERIGWLNATFEEKTLKQVLRGTAAALNLRYRKVGRTVTFFRPHPDIPPPEVAR